MLRLCLSLPPSFPLKVTQKCSTRTLHNQPLPPPPMLCLGFSHSCALLASLLKYTVTQESLILPHHTPPLTPQKELSQMWNVPSPFADRRLSCVSLKIVQSRLTARKEEALSRASQRAPPSRLENILLFLRSRPSAGRCQVHLLAVAAAGLDKEISRFANQRKIHPCATSIKPLVLVLSQTEWI